MARTKTNCYLIGKISRISKNIRNHQVKRATKLIENHPQKLGKARPNDPKRFITIIHATEHGEIIDTLRDMNLKPDKQEIYSTNYIRTDLTDDLHDTFSFRTDYEVMTEKNLLKICKQIKNVRIFLSPKKPLNPL